MIGGTRRLHALRPARGGLRSEKEIKANWSDADADPAISICCATYNHAAWIEDALRGFLAQETRYSFEIIVRDDASSDGTREIVADYAEKYPGLIKAILNKENRFGAGERAMWVWPEVARGRYWAFCEGDDFWISRDKLEIQASWMDAHPDYVFSCHDFYNAEGQLIARPAAMLGEEGEFGSEFGAEAILTRNFVATNTAFFRSKCFASLPRSQLFMLDWPLWLHLSLCGRCFYHRSLYGCYRDHGQGLWSGLTFHQRAQRELQFYDFAANAYPEERERVERKKMEYVSRIILDHQDSLNELADLRRNPVKYLARGALRRVLRKAHGRRGPRC